jgi:CHAT domain-containing protein
VNRATKPSQISPLVIRLAHGDITEAQASVVAINHINGLPPAGAQAAIDAALGGALSRRAASGGLDAHFGATTFLPVTTARLAARAVLVVGLGEAEKFSATRLEEVGIAIVDALATFRIRDAATIVHGAGTAGVAPKEAAARLLSGIYEALERVPGAESVREVTIVENDEARLAEIAEGAAAARAPANVHVYVQPENLPRRPEAAPGDVAPADGVPRHLRIGITRAGPELKVVVASEDSPLQVDTREWPEADEDRIVDRLDSEVLRESDPGARERALKAIGGQLYKSFLGWSKLDVSARLKETRGGYLILGCDQMTVRLPWELLFDGEDFVCKTHLVSRQLEINAVGRMASYPASDDTLKVLIVGNPTGDLPGAHKEAHSIARALRKTKNAEVKALVGDVSWEDVSRELNNDYDVLHYAGHARFDELRHGASGFILKNGTLTADDLSTRTFLPRLIVANACNSAKADGDLFDGAPPTRDLVQGMLSAGARAVIGSMWKVDDRAASTFGQVFYRSLTPGVGQPRGAATVGEAVLRARQAVVEKHGIEQPAWAGYALYGSPWKSALSVGG